MYIYYFSFFAYKPIVFFFFFSLCTVFISSKIYSFLYIFIKALKGEYIMKPYTVTIEITKRTQNDLDSVKREDEHYEMCIRRLIKEREHYKILYMRESVKTRKILEVLLIEDEEWA